MIFVIGQDIGAQYRVFRNAVGFNINVVALEILVFFVGNAAAQGYERN